MASGWKAYADAIRARTQEWFPRPAAAPAHERNQQEDPHAKLHSPIRAAEGAAFPVISEAKLQRLFPAQTSSGSCQHACVRAALRDMERACVFFYAVAYHMDPCLAKQKSDTTQGYWLLAELVRRVAVESTDAFLPPFDPSGAPISQERTHSVGSVRAVRTYEPHDVYAAVERQDIDTIMAIRDADFVLLLGGDDRRTPLEYAISLGPRYERVSLFLAGALSRFVNQLPDQMQDASDATLATLRKVRTNLKLAIDHSLDRDQTALLASYIQILVMAEGVGWVDHAVKTVAHELGRTTHDPYAPRPTQVARDSVGQFLTRNLRVRRQRDQCMVATMEDYIANAASDLVLLALWERVRGAEPPLPVYAFARDDRIATAFCICVQEAARQGPRQPSRIWTQAQQAAEAFQAGLRRRTAGERLALLGHIVD